MRVLVTGAGGFVGRSLVAHLVQDGHDVTAFVRSSGAPLPGVARTVRGDMTDESSLRVAINDIDAVVHCAALKSDEPDSHLVNVGGMCNLIAACKSAGVERVVYISSASVKLAHKGVYGATKQEAEALLLQSGLRAAILRPSIIYGDDAYGAFGALMRAARFPVIPVFGAGTSVFYPLHVEDLAQAIAMVLTNDTLLGRTYDVGGPDAVSFDALLRLLRQDVLRRPSPRILHLPQSIGSVLARALRLFFSRPPITESNVLGSTQVIAWDREAFFRDSGFAPRSLAAGLRAVIRCQQEKEADVLYAYVYSRSGFSPPSSPALRERYAVACAASHLTPMHSLLSALPVLIGPLDAVTRIFYPQSPLRKRLLMACALAETDPSSAPWLYPRTRSLTALFARVVLLCLSASIKLVAGIMLALVPGFVKTYAG